MATFLQKIKLLRGLSTGERAYAGPILVTVGVTRRCNLQCLGCRYHSPLIHIPPPEDPGILDILPDLFEKLCQELTSMGTGKLVLTGEGEPLLHPDLFDFISTAKGAGFHVTLFTNGTLLDEVKTQALIDSRLDALIVSLWTSSPEEYEQNYPGTNPDHFRRVVEGLNLLSAFKANRKTPLPSVILYHPINRYNYEKIASIAELGHATGCSGLHFVPFITHSGELAQHALSPVEEKRLCHSLIQMKQRLDSVHMNHNIDEIVLRYRIGEAVWEILPCYTGWFHARIKVEGTVFPCAQYHLSLGSLEKTSFREIWNSPAYRTFRRQTLTRRGLASVAKNCDCGFCCFVSDNNRIHQIFRHLSPFLLRGKA